MTRILCAVLFIAASVPTLSGAQQPTQRQLDSLAAEVRALRVRLDSLRAAVLRSAPPRRAADTARAGVDEDLAALRAAAASAVGRDTTQTADTVSSRKFVGRERNQAQLNPEISATGDVRAYATTSGVQRENFDPHEFEVGFQSALDPYSHTKIFLAFGNGEIEVEEGYAYWIGLPGHLDVGRHGALVWVSAQIDCALIDFLETVCRVPIGGFNRLRHRDVLEGSLRRLHTGVVLVAIEPDFSQRRIAVDMHGIGRIFEHRPALYIAFGCLPGHRKPAGGPVCAVAPDEQHRGDLAFRVEPALGDLRELCVDVHELGHCIALLHKGRVLVLVRVV